MESHNRKWKCCARKAQILTSSSKCLATADARRRQPRPPSTLGAATRALDKPSSHKRLKHEAECGCALVFVRECLCVGCFVGGLPFSARCLRRLSHRFIAQTALTSAAMKNRMQPTTPAVSACKPAGFCRLSARTIGESSNR